MAMVSWTVPRWRTCRASSAVSTSSTPTVTAACPGPSCRWSGRNSGSANPSLRIASSSVRSAAAPPAGLWQRWSTITPFLPPGSEPGIDMKLPHEIRLLPLLLVFLAPAAFAQMTLPEPTQAQKQALQQRWAKADTNQDGYIDRAEADALNPISKNFDVLDADRDGRLSQAEMKNSVLDRLRAADTNQNGDIDRAEADASLPRVARAFDRLDLNADGKLSVEEVQQVASRFAGRRQGQR
ncbi:hypothetical protein D9R12_13825 [Pseudoxanthomonas spadix]|nr:hypothetical protein D9R12_13825 [Pseudoxanthomonas spadix]